MGERKGTNKYYPPDFDPKKHRSLDAYHGTHALRERARKLGEGILIIRFEMPYNIWCGKCENHIGMGVRYNAEKSKVGKYYSTPIYKFRMKCHLCDNHFEIKTDPANHDYVIISGARRKEQRWDPKENEQIVPEDKDDQKKLAKDPMYKLEHGADDKNRSKAAKTGIAQLEASKEQWKDDYSLNRLMRNEFREKKKTQKVQTEKDKALLAKASLEIELVPENPEDVKMAHLLGQYRTVNSYEEKRKQKREEIENRSIFQSTTASGSSSSDVTSPTSSSSTESSSGSSGAGVKHTEARKTLDHLVSRNKHNPFTSPPGGTSTSKQPLPRTPQNLGIVRKGKQTPGSAEMSTSSGKESKEANNKTYENLSEKYVEDSDKLCQTTSQSMTEDEHQVSGMNLGQPNALNSLMSTYTDSSEED